MNHLLAVMVGYESPAVMEEFVKANQATGALQQFSSLAAQVNSMSPEALIGYVFENWKGFALSLSSLLKFSRALPHQQLVRLALAVRLRQFQPGLRMNSSYGALLNPMDYKAATPGAKAAKGL
ncbi:MAG: hypothetical protein NFW04_05255 [Candidatus Accumulibacter sp.]|uniref:hypothetical protein n=1 Tax=Accumulibacter sp. TaxID=2053492 RepID=UPI0025E8D185|nr:hypothetical protein [Accumulibacter sp.]MCM8598048.1 hypothetical protein [Accumulibacter sp.]